MPKGDKKKKNSAPVKEARSLLEKDDVHEYGFVTKKLGGSNFSVRLNLQEKEVIGHICGKLRAGIGKKNNWIDVGSVVLVGMRDFQKNKVDIVYSYTHDEVRRLKKGGALVEIEEHMVVDDSEAPMEQEFAFEEI